MMKFGIRDDSAVQVESLTQLMLGMAEEFGTKLWLWRHLGCLYITEEEPDIGGASVIWETEQTLH